MFGAKRQLEQKPEDYTKWQEDFGFLNLILNRKKNITKQYVINVYSNQKSETDYMTDDELEPIIENIVKECRKCGSAARGKVLFLLVVAFHKFTIDCVGVNA